jgi:hypothetical protein
MAVSWGNSGGKKNYLVFFLFLFATGSCYAAQAGLTLEILLRHPPKCWDYRRAPLSPTPLSLHSKQFLFKEKLLAHRCIK